MIGSFPNEIFTERPFSSEDKPEYFALSVKGRVLDCDRWSESVPFFLLFCSQSKLVFLLDFSSLLQREKEFIVFIPVLLWVTIEDNCAKCCHEYKGEEIYV